MVVYHPHDLTLSTGQMKSLGKGEKVRLKPAQLQGDMTVLLTKTQIGRIMKAIEGGKGMELRLSQAQLKENSKRVGGGTYVPAYTNKRNSLTMEERRAGLERLRKADAQDRKDQVPMTTKRYYSKQRELHKYY